MKKNRFIYAILLLLFTFLMIMYDGWQTQVLLWLVVLLPVVLAVFAYRYSRNIQIYFDETEEYCQRDNHINKYIMLKNNTPFAIPRVDLKVCIEDYQGNKTYRTLVLNAEAYTIRNFAMEMAFEHYGMMKIHVEKILVYDYLGITRFKRQPEISTVIYVFPEYSEQIFIDNRKLFQEEGAQSELRIGVNGSDRSEVLENNEYRDGDDIRNIHWKLSSRSDTLIVKHFGYPKEGEIHIYVDVEIDKDSRYESCDGILSATYAMVSACEKEGIPYRIWACRDGEVFQTELRSLLDMTVESAREGHGYDCVRQIQTHGGTGICITSEKIDKGRLETNADYLEYDWKQSQEHRYIISDNTVINVAADKDEAVAKPFFIRENNDRIRVHEKINISKYSEKYLFLQSVIATLASLLAVVSVYDVIYVRSSAIIQAVFTVLFVLFHFVIYYITMEKEQDKGNPRMRTRLIMIGYVLVILIAQPDRIISGVESIVDLFNWKIEAYGNYYGFLEIVDADINWLLILVAYAVVDVIFNFCVDFVLWIHVLLIVPLISICMIVGSMPPVSVTFMMGIYLPLIFVVHQCLRHGKGRSRKSLSDDYVYTGNIAISAGIVTVLVSIVILVLATLFALVGGYETPQWITDSKKKIQEVLQVSDWGEGLVDFNITTGELNEESNGWLDDTKEIEYTGEAVFMVNVSENVPDSFYIKDYVGTHYNKKAWVERSQTEIAEEEELVQKKFKRYDYDDFWSETGGNERYEVADFREYFTFRQTLAQQSGGLRIWNGDLKSYRMEIIMLNEEHSSIPMPYCADGEGIPVWGDGYLLTLQEGYKEKYIYEGYVTDGYPQWNMDWIDAKDDIFEPWVISQAYYNYVMENYRSIPEVLKDDMKQFQNVSVNYKGENYKLISGETKFETIGYEPYVQYVRQYFEDNGYEYDISVTRKNNYNDFIEDFMKRKTGYCTHYASTAVMMFRSMGIPARYAEGYYVKDKYKISEDEDGRMYRVPDEAAHAWVEIYCFGAGWIPVEVTPGTEDFVVLEEESMSKEPEETSTTKAEEKTTSKEQKETTKIVAQKDTTAEEETTTTAKVEQNESDQETKRSLKNYLPLLIPVGCVFLYLLYYQCKSEAVAKILVSKDKQERMKKLTWYFRCVTRCFYKGWKEYETNEEKALYLKEQMYATDVQISDVVTMLTILDKIYYAPIDSVTDEELERFYQFLVIYGSNGYEHGNFGEKIMYKYIKCLYLKEK